MVYCPGHGLLRPCLAAWSSPWLMIVAMTAVMCVCFQDEYRGQAGKRVRLQRDGLRSTLRKRTRCNLRECNPRYSTDHLRHRDLQRCALKPYALELHFHSLHLTACFPYTWLIGSKEVAFLCCTSKTNFRYTVRRVWSSCQGNTERNA
jgi:hypothetical protein